MTIDPEKLKWLALAALWEIVDRVEERPMAPTLSIRVALATAFAFSDGNKKPYIGFWRTMQDPFVHQTSPTIANYCRSTYLMIQLRGIMRSMGVPDTVETSETVSSIRKRCRQKQEAE